MMSIVLAVLIVLCLAVLIRAHAVHAESHRRIVAAALEAAEASRQALAVSDQACWTPNRHKASTMLRSQRPKRSYDR